MGRTTYRKIITSKELIEQINPVNKKIINRFLKNFDTKRADSSVTVYTSNFNIFFCWNVKYNDNKEFTNIRKSELLDFFDFAVEELHWSPNRYAQMWSSLSSLSNFIENILDDDYPDFRNQVKKIEKTPKALVRKKTILNETQINRLLKNLYDSSSYQEACALALMVYSGSRVSEIFRFTLEIIDIGNTAYEGLFLETTEEIKTKGRGKTGKMLYKYILKAPFIQYYENWILKRKSIMDENKINHNYLFIKNDGTPASCDILRGWINKWEKFLSNDIESNPNLDKIYLYAHCLRHYLVTYLSRIGLESDLIVSLFGWSSSEMYNIYNDLTAKDKQWKGLNKLKEAINE